MISLAIDVVIVALLGAALAYGWFISRRVTRLMGALHELEPMVRAFSEAVDKSEGTVKDLRAAATTAADTALHRVEPRLTAQPAPMPAPVQAPVQASAPAPDSDATFASRRQRAAMPEPAGLMRLGANKADLVRGFFETSRSRAV